MLGGFLRCSFYFLRRSEPRNFYDFSISPCALSSSYKGSDSRAESEFPRRLFFPDFSYFLPPLSRLLTAHIRRQTFRRNFDNFALRYLSVLGTHATMLRVLGSFSFFIFFCPEIRGRNKFKSLCSPSCALFAAQTFVFSRVDDTRKQETQIGRRNGTIYGTLEACAMTSGALKSPAEKSSRPGSIEPERFP